MESIICFGENNSTRNCIVSEKKALMKFKSSFLDPSNRLSSWDNHKDCCAWDGVKCDKITRHVISLDLNNKYGRIDNMLQANQLDSSLLELNNLIYLDLSCNDFRRSPIPAFLGSMKLLQHLNLSTTNFVGVIPHNLGNLSSLRVLDLNFAGYLMVNDLIWASNLSFLEYLDMSYIDLSRTKSLVKVLDMLPSLVVLRLSQSGLGNLHLTPHACVNLTRFSYIEYIDLSMNSFEGDFPCFLQNMTSLKVLDLSYNRYNTSDPIRLRLTNLAHLNLRYNLLHHDVDWLSEFLRDKCHLKSLDLENNKFRGEISVLFKNMSGCWINKLQKLSLRVNEFHGNLPEEIGELKKLNQLDLSVNEFSGPIPWSLGKLSALSELYISDNMLSGSIPSSLGNMRSLRALYLRYNQLSGDIPTPLGKLSNLEDLDISFNFFNTTFCEAHFAKLSKLENLCATSNMFVFKVGFDWAPPFQLKSLNLQSCKIGGQFPQWLQTQKELTSLDLSNCSISGTLPNWLQYINLTEFHLSHNDVKGPVPRLASSLTTLDLSNNMINHFPRNIGHMLPRLQSFILAQNSIKGPIPESLCEMKALRTLDLSNNYLSGNIPNCWAGFQELEVMRLSSNELSGVIPNSIGGAYSLQWLHLNNNNLTGKFPYTLKNCTQLVLLDVGGNKLTGTLPKWIGENLLNIKFLSLWNNEFYGVIPSGCVWIESFEIHGFQIHRQIHLSSFG